MFRHVLFFVGAYNLNVVFSLLFLSFCLVRTFGVIILLGEVLKPPNSRKTIVAKHVCEVEK